MKWAGLQGCTKFTSSKETGPGASSLLYPKVPGRLGVYFRENREALRNAAQRVPSAILQYGLSCMTQTRPRDDADIARTKWNID